MGAQSHAHCCSRKGHRTTQTWTDQTDTCEFEIKWKGFCNCLLLSIFQGNVEDQAFDKEAALQQPPPLPPPEPGSDDEGGMDGDEEDGERKKRKKLVSRGEECFQSAPLPPPEPGSSDQGDRYGG